MDARTPTCLACSTKFAGDPCRKCGLPAAVTDPLAVREHREALLVAAAVPKSARKAELRSRGRGGSVNRRRRAHGRR